MPDDHVAHRFDPAKMGFLDRPERRSVLPPEELLKKLPIQSDDTVVDLGAGTGYFSIPAARMTRAEVHAVDVEPKMTAVLQQRAAEAGVDNIRVAHGQIEAVPLLDETADVVIASMVLHEVQPLEQGLKEIHRLLKPNGKLLCVDWEHKESEHGPPLAVRIPSQELERALEEVGLRVVEREFPEDHLYVMFATKQADSPGR